MPSGKQSESYADSGALCANEVFAAGCAYAPCAATYNSHYAYALVLSEFLNKHLHISQLAGICLSTLPARLLLLILLLSHSPPYLLLLLLQCRGKN